MTVQFSCPKCGRELRSHERAIGRKARCPDCGTSVVIPAPVEKRTEADQAAAEQPVEEPQPIEPVAARSAQEVPRHYETPAEAPPLAAPPPPPPRPRKQKKTRTKSGVAGASEPPLLTPFPPHPEGLIDMTAMVDIVFFLLIFFLVTSLQALEAVMDMPTPQAAEGGAASSKSVTDLENDPAYILVKIEDDDSIWVEDAQVFSDQDLIIRIRAAKAEQDRPRSLLVMADADASHGAAVRVFDAGAGAGVNGISLVVHEKTGQ
jgi:biopolymer transport protein ExbD